MICFDSKATVPAFSWLFSVIHQQVAKWDEQIESGSFPGKIWKHHTVSDQDSKQLDIMLLTTYW